MLLLIPVITILMLLMIAPYISNCLTCFASAQVYKLQHAMPVQLGYIYITTPDHGKYHSPLDQFSQSVQLLSRVRLFPTSL